MNRKTANRLAARIKKQIAEMLGERRVRVEAGEWTCGESGCTTMNLLLTGDEDELYEFRDLAKAIHEEVFRGEEVYLDVFVYAVSGTWKDNLITNVYPHFIDAVLVGIDRKFPRR